MKTRSYSELRRYKTLEDRFHYLKLGGEVGAATFGSDRYLNQAFYRSREWKMIRDEVIVRDEGCDLGVPGYEIHEAVYIHHMNSLSVEHLAHGDDSALDPEFLITTTHRTHNAIHYGDETLLPKVYIPRRPGDTRLW
jgi:hypothetical protein